MQLTEIFPQSNNVDYTIGFYIKSYSLMSKTKMSGF